jgi:hypothetical protein
MESRANSHDIENGKESKRCCISLLPILSKVLEKILLKRLAPEINDQQLMPAHEFGFRKGHGTIEQIGTSISKPNS